MNWDAIGAIGELVGASAVVVTLVYLAVQVKHVVRYLMKTEELHSVRSISRVLTL